MEKNIILCILLLMGFGACKKDTPDIPPPTTLPPNNSANIGKGVFITSEGGFGHSNASLTYWSYADGKVIANVFDTLSNPKLGDVCQSMSLFNGKAYVVVNNSGKIEMMDPKTLRSVATISGLNSPRYFLGLNDKAYVTDFKANAVTVLNLSSNTVSKNIPCKGWTEELLLAENRVFVTNLAKEYVYVINTATDAIEDSIRVGFGSGSIKRDKNGKIWVLCGGDASKKLKPGLYQIDPVSKTVSFSLDFSNTSDKPSHLCINGTGDTLYFLNKGVYRMPVNSKSLPTEAFISSGDNLFYGLGIHPGTSEIYVCDAVDYVQKGWVYVFRPSDGAKTTSLQAGIIPGNFCFYIP